MRSLAVAWRMSLGAVALVFACVTTPASASDEPDPSRFARTGFQLRAGAAFAFEDSQALRDLNTSVLAALNANPPPFVPPGTTFEVARLSADPAIGFTLGASQRFHPRFAAGVSYDWMRGDVEFQLTATLPAQLGTRTVTQDVGTWTVWTVTGDLRGYLFTNRIQPYGAIGLGAMGQEFVSTHARAAAASDRTAFLPRFGGGVDIYLADAALINVDVGYLLGTGALDDANAVSIRLGVAARF
jgi:opacity protein-like surface antigen